MIFPSFWNERNIFFCTTDLSNAAFIQFIDEALLSVYNEAGSRMGDKSHCRLFPRIAPESRQGLLSPTLGCTYLGLQVDESEPEDVRLGIY